MASVRVLRMVGLLSLLMPVAANAQTDASATASAPAATADTVNYLIGPGDDLQIFVWKNPDLSTQVPVRPDGKITTPLVQDIQAQGKTPTELAASLKAALANYIQDPIVTVVVKSFAAPDNSAAIRVIGAAVTPKTIPFRAGMTALDVLIDVGGLNNFASGNRAELIRKVNGRYTTIPLHLADLVKSGDLRANVQMMPGDVIRVPERFF
jgi:polysaccharide export outer membrane protein